MADEEIKYEVVDRDTGEVIPPDRIAFAYTREGRRVIGREFPNPTPVAPPIGFVPQKPIYEQIRDMVRREMSLQAEDEEMETFEESDDFEVGDDYDPTSPYEEQFEPEDPWPPTAAVRDAENAVAATRPEPAPVPTPPPAPPPPAKSGGEGGPPPS